MNSQEIYKLANEIKEQEVENVLSGWFLRNEIEKINTFNSLVKLGDSKELACATVMINTIVAVQNNEFYKNAYGK